MSVSIVLSCRISIADEGGRIILALFKPTTLLVMCISPQLAALAQAVEGTIVQIMKNRH